MRLLSSAEESKLQCGSGVEGMVGWDSGAEFRAVEDGEADCAG